MRECCEEGPSGAEDAGFRRVLWVALGINAAMFAVELAASFLARSVAVQADALDFLGDAGNYAISLLVISMGMAARARAALLKAAVMAGFGLWVLASALIHAAAGVVPEAQLMGAVGFLALGANIGVAVLLYRHRSRDSNALSVWLCSRNDAIANVAVILAGAGVWATMTPWPDILVAIVIAGLGLSAAVRVIPRAAEELRRAWAAGAG